MGNSEGGGESVEARGVRREESERVRELFTVTTATSKQRGQTIMQHTHVLARVWGFHTIYMDLAFSSLNRLQSKELSASFLIRLHSPVV